MPCESVFDDTFFFFAKDGLGIWLSLIELRFLLAKTINFTASFFG